MPAKVLYIGIQHTSLSLHLAAYKIIYLCLFAPLSLKRTHTAEKLICQSPASADSDYIYIYIHPGNRSLYILHALAKIDKRSAPIKLYCNYYMANSPTPYWISYRSVYQKWDISCIKYPRS